MAVYERDRARIVIRVVYDGPGRAGKTTNVEQLARIFGNKPGNELQVFPAATGRTIFFDWFSFDGGMIDGHQLQVQVVTVPGHKSLEPRRAHILRSADVVVLVCDSAVSGQDSAREMLDSLREYLGKSVPNVPLIVQANKQDLANAMLPHELGKALGLTYDVPVIGAQASAGIGVRETAIGAIRAAVRQMKRRTARQGLDAIVGEAGTVDELRAALQAIEAVNAGRAVGERRPPEDEARRVAPSALADEGRVVYIRSHSVVTQLAGGVHGEANGRARATSAKAAPSTMSDPPDSERPRRTAVPVSAMFIEPRPANSPPEVAGIPAGSVPSAIHVPPPPVLARSFADERAPATDSSGVLALLEDGDDALAFGERDAGSSSSTLALLFERDRAAELDAPRPPLAPESVAAPPMPAVPESEAAANHELDGPGDGTGFNSQRDASIAATDDSPLLAPTSESFEVEEPSIAPSPDIITAAEPVLKDSPATADQELADEPAPPSLAVVDEPTSSPQIAEPPPPLVAVGETTSSPELADEPPLPSAAAIGETTSSPELADEPALPSAAAVDETTPSPDLADGPAPPSLAAAGDTTSSPQTTDTEPAPSTLAAVDETTPSLDTADIEPTPSNLAAVDDTTSSIPQLAASDPTSSSVDEPVLPITSSSDIPDAEAAPTMDASPELATEQPGAPAPLDAPAGERVDADERDVTAATEAPKSADPLDQPALPGPELPPGHVWPVPGGRAVLEQLAGQPLTPIVGLEGHARKSMSFRSAGYHLRTRPEWRFRERERGREALIEHVRRAARLGPLRPAGIAVALAAGADEHALWHIVPDLPSLGAELRGAAEAERPRHLARLAAAYAMALRLVAREDVALELDPYAFAEQDGRWVYLDDRLREPEQAPGLVSALLAPCADLPGPLVDAWLGALEQALPATLTREDVAALGLEGELEAAATSLARDVEAQQAVTRVRATLDRCT